ncbi:MAG: hypothetical protein K2L34_06545, partial [Muribaculaceae bacterium]|nr:hypothetical protein [Muribaculaceae bacterium]
TTGYLTAALKFYAEAIKYSTKPTGRVTRKEVKMTIEMAEIMMRLKAMRPRALRLLNAVLPHAEALETIELERDILALIEVINSEQQNESAWKNFFRKISLAAKSKFSKKQQTNEATEEAEAESGENHLAEVVAEAAEAIAAESAAEEAAVGVAAAAEAAKAEADTVIAEETAEASVTPEAPEHPAEETEEKSEATEEK